MCGAGWKKDGCLCGSSTPSICPHPHGRTTSAYADAFLRDEVTPVVLVELGAYLRPSWEGTVHRLAQPDTKQVRADADQIIHKCRHK